MQVSIVIPTYNHLEDCLRPCLESIFKYTTVDVEIIVSANGCTDGTKEYLNSITDKRLIVVWNDEALGYTRATNAGIKASTGDIIVLLNNDTILLTQPVNEWLYKLCQPFDETAVGITGPMKAFSPEGERWFLIFFCVAVRRAVFETVGLLDESYSPGFGEDTDLCFRAEDAGYKIIQVPNESKRYLDDQQQKMVGDFPIFHEGEATFRHIPNVDAVLAERRAMLHQRWNKKPVKLNLGCGDKKLDGYINIDLYNPAADVKLDVRDLNHYASNSISEVLALHVLEHISPYEVEKTLKEWFRVLKPGGKVIIEMPDISQLCENFSKTTDKDAKYRILNCIYGTTQIAHPHLFGWYGEILSDFLQLAGFSDIQQKEPEYKEHWGYNMRMEAIKGGNAVAPVPCEITMLPKRQLPAPVVAEEPPKEDLPKGYFTPDNIAKYRQLVGSLPDGGVMAELGVWLGKSLCSVADIIKQKNLTVYAVDTFKGTAGEPAKLDELAKENNIVAEFMSNIAKYGLAKHVRLLQQPTHDAAKAIHEPLDMVFIDADHNYMAVKLDILDWGIAKVKDGGIIAGHDYSPDHPGVISVVDEIFGPNFAAYQGIWWARKGGAVVQKNRIYDCFPFNNELDILEIRLNELYDVVDQFVLVEARKRHSGLAKPLYFEENKERFAKFFDKITHVVVDDFPEGDPWVLENYQRACIRRGLRDCTDNDIIIVSDADEIPSADAVTRYRVADGPMCLGQRLHYYYLNYRDGDWNHGKIFPHKLLKEKNFEEIRRLDCPVLHNGGWHFSFLGDVDHIIQKIESFADQQLNTAEMKDRARIEECLKTGTDLFGRSEYKFTAIEIDSSFPEFVRNNAEALANRGLIRLTKANVLPTVKSNNLTVTCEIATKNRLLTTLPSAIMSIAGQTKVPDRLLIFDDGDYKDPREHSIYRHIFNLLSQKGIAWEWLYAPQKGQVLCHQMALDATKTDLIWRVDDDDYAEANVLERLMKIMEDPQVGACSGRVLVPGNVPASEHLSSPRVQDVNCSHNIQWCEFKGLRETEHLHNTFLYRKAAAKHGFRSDLSPAGHREETYFTYEMKRAGWKLIVDSDAVIWHLREGQGGIRSYTQAAFWDEDEKKFERQLEFWGLKSSGSKLYVLNNGMGDHYSFKMLLPEIRAKYPKEKIRIAVCYPQVFEDEPDVEIMSIADALLMDPDQDKYNVFKWGAEQGWAGSMLEAYRKMYLS